MHEPRRNEQRSHDHDETRAADDAQHHCERPTQGAITGTDMPLASTGSLAHASVPSSPAELVAMQQLLNDVPQAPLAKQARVAQALTLLRSQELDAWGSQQIALALLQHLESYHQGVVAELQECPESTPAQMACWAIDGDRLMHCRRLLESITLI